MPTLEWHSVRLSPIVLITGAEQLLADRAAARLRALALEADPQTEVTRTSASGYTGGTLSMLTSPSLFQEKRHVELDDAQSGTDAFYTDVIGYLSAPSPDATVAVIHRGGNRGKKLLDAMRRAKIPTVTAAPLKKPAERASFAGAEFTRAKRKARPDAVAALVEGTGGDLAELAAVIAQLVADTQPDGGKYAPVITADDVHTYLRGRVDTKAFTVADAAIAGRRADALMLLRQSLESGVDPVPMIAALASKMRSLAKVSGIGHGVTAKQLGMPDWMVRNLRKDARAWSDRGIRQAIEACAQGDVDVKGGSRDADYAVQRTVLAICGARTVR